jgi:hypothetical protein
MIPFERIPRLMVIRAVATAVFWINAFPHADGMSDTLSPRYLMTGRHLDFNKHVRTELFGAYVQTHEEHTNNMNARTLGAICLGPSENEQGGHYFMSLSTDACITRYRWTDLPMPDDVIGRVAAIARRQGMPRTLTFADRYGLEMVDDDGDTIDDDQDSNYDSNDNNDNFSDDDSDADCNDDPDNDNPVATNNAPDLPVEPTGVDDDEQQGNEDEEDVNDTTEVDNQPPDDQPQDAADEEVGTPGVGNPEEDVDATEEDANDEEAPPSEEEAPAPFGGHRLRTARKPAYDHMYKFNFAQDTSHEPMGELFMSEQMSLKRGLKEFGEEGTNAVIKELKQLDYRDAIKPLHARHVTREQQKAALRYLMYLKQKRQANVNNHL